MGALVEGQLLRDASGSSFHRTTGVEHNEPLVRSMAQSSEPHSRGDIPNRDTVVD